MRSVKGKLLLAILTALASGLVALPARTNAAPAGGLTVSPATARLSLAADESHEQSVFTITNNYASPVVLGFHFTAGQHATANDKQVLASLSVASPDVTLAPRQSFEQRITLAASPTLAPGSQQAELVIAQSAIQGAQVGVLPELRLPIILIKEDGAISSFVASAAFGSVALTMPKTIDITVRNTGNMIVLPRGVVTITAPGGQVVGQGTLNSSSMGLAPNAAQKLTVPLTATGTAWLPGPYNIHVRYGLGGDHPVHTSSTGFAYIAWWHGVVGVGLIASAYYLSHHVAPAYLRQRRHKDRAPPKRTPAMGKDGS